MNEKFREMFIKPSLRQRFRVPGALFSIIALVTALSLPCIAEETYDPETDPLLEGVVERAHDFDENHLGYPVNEDIELDEFYEWYLKNEVGHAMMNNAGDPNDIGANHGALEVEAEVLRYFAPFYGFDPDDTWGLISASGTDGNDHGIYFGRHYLTDKTGLEPILYVSTESHYSNKRLAELQQLEVRMIDTDEMGRMIPESFEEALDPERPALVVFSMGTTFKGGIDDQAAINAIIDEAGLPAVYRHVDAALFGGYLPFSEYADKVDREVCGFDSIAVSGHKFFGMDEPCGLFFTTKEVMEHQNPYDISYLEGSMPMINCSRSALNPLKFYWIIKHTGEEGFREKTESMLDNTAYLKDKLDEMEWPAWVSDECSNTVFFARPDDDIMQKYFLAPDYDERFGGDLAHVIVMPNVDKELIDRFIDDLQAAAASAAVSSSVSSVGTAESEQPGRRMQITEDFMSLIEQDSELEKLVEKSIQLAAVNNPDPVTNPVQSMEEYYDFLDWSAACMPWNILDGQDETDIYRSIDQSLDYFYYLLDQPLPELAGKGLYYPCLEYYEPIASWCKEYASSWGEFLSGEESWNNEYYDLVCADEAFGMNTGWYAETNIWTSFNDWFSRTLTDENQRPISDADIVAPADSTPQGIWTIDENSQLDMGVQLKSTKFYNVEQIIGEDSEYESEFANGILTHTFLDVNDYHRYHFPLSGTILEVRKIEALDAVGGLIAWSPEENRYVLYDENPGWQSVETRDCLIMDTESTDSSPSCRLLCLRSAPATGKTVL